MTQNERLRHAPGESALAFGLRAIRKLSVVIDYTSLTWRAKGTSFEHSGDLSSTIEYAFYTVPLSRNDSAKKPRIGLGHGGASLYGEVYRTRECSAAVPSLHRNAVRPKRKVSRIIHILGRGVEPHYPVYVDLQLAEG